MQVLAFLSAWLVWVPICVWVVSLVQWMIAGEIEGITGFLGIVVAMALGIITLTTQVQIAKPFLFLAAVITVVMYPLVREAMNNRELRGIDVDLLGNAYQALEARPDNAIARLTLAKKAYALGYIAPAIGIAEEALTQLPKAVFEGEQKMVKRWKDYARHDSRGNLLPPCPRCNTVNAASATHCSRCGSPFLLDRSRIKFAPSAQGRKLLAVWGSMVAALAGIPSATALPPLASLLVIFGILGAVAAVLILTFRSGATSA